MQFRLAILLFVCVLGFNSQAQNIPKHAIGLRFSGGVLFGGALNYQYAPDEANRFEFNIGRLGGKEFSSTEIQITYQWVFPLDDRFDWYAGGGGKLGFQSQTAYDLRTPLGLSLVGQAGIQYTFDIPLNISLDVCPDVLAINYGYDRRNWLNLNLGVRYLLF
jgi:hypothetical protein